MAITLSPSNVITFIGALSPIIIASYLLLDSFINYNVKAIIYIFGLIIAQFIGIISRKLWGQKRPYIAQGKSGEYVDYTKSGPKHDFCSFFEYPFTNTLGQYSAPSTHGVFHSFTLSYLALGFASNPNHPGLGFIILIILFGSLDSFFRIKNRCDQPSDILIGCVIGLILGVTWWSLITYGWPGPEYTYFSVEHNMKKCKLGAQKFKCRKRSDLTSSN